MHDSQIERPVLFIFSGLPGSGKSTLAQVVAQQFEAVFLRIDTIEQGLRDLCSIDVQGEGYRLAYRIAADNLGLGRNVVADSCNPIELTRREWEQVARDSHADFINIEIICSDASEHRLRVETRVVEVPGRRLPTWRDVRKPRVPRLDGRQNHHRHRRSIPSGMCERPACETESMASLNSQAFFSVGYVGRLGGSAGNSNSVRTEQTSPDFTALRN